MLRSATSPAASLRAMLLVFALLFAQMAGLGHRIAHRDGAGGPATGLFSWLAPEWGAPHSCLAYDAATLAQLLASPPYLVARLPFRHVVPGQTSFCSWQASFRRLFSPRAPPVQ